MPTWRVGIVSVLVLGGVAIFQPVLAMSGPAFRDCDICPEMVVVPPGAVKAGDPNDFDDHDDPERLSIVIERPFAIGRFEVTQAEWEAIMGDNPSSSKGAKMPVVQVKYVDVMEYISRINAKTGKQYRLPTEAEWEYAARAGSEGLYSFGNDSSELGKFGWYEGNSGGSPKPVGKLAPNAFGIHDMHGNVWEWTSDCFGSSYAAKLPDDFAKDRENHCYRVIRGGSAFNFPKYLTAFSRSSLTPVNFNVNLGFRLALTLE